MNSRSTMRRILAAAPLGVLAGMLLCAARSQADGPLAHHRHMENRFLFVIDTSSAMKSRTNGLEEAVTSLLASDMKGELRKGDTIGLWTYSDSLSTAFPMQVWSEAKRDDIINGVREHLHILLYDKRSHLEKAWPAIHQVVAASERLTVVLIFDGTDVIKGTPFDKDINSLHKQYARAFRSAHEPFVTILAARDGAIFDYTINHPSSVMVPHMADPLPPPETNAPPPEPVAPPPLAVTNPPAHRIVINLTGDDFPHHTNIDVAQVAPEPEPAAPAVTNAPVPAPAEAVAAQAAQAAPAVNTNVSPPEAVPAPPPAAGTPPAAPAVTAPENSSPVEHAPPLTLVPVAPAAIIPARVAPAVAEAAPFQQAAMWVMACSLLTIAVALVVLLVWRWRSRSQPSLISQSLDRAR
jgi:hypothetical protein